MPAAVAKPQGSARILQGEFCERQPTAGAYVRIAEQQSDHRRGPLKLLRHSLMLIPASCSYLPNP